MRKGGREGGGRKEGRKGEREVGREGIHQYKSYVDFDTTDRLLMEAVDDRFTAKRCRLVGFNF